MAYWAAAIDAASEIGTAWLNSDAQHNANRTNIRLAKENRDWTEVMSNTAVRRRAFDIEAAGGNRALAFTNGQEASSPTLTPARVDPPKFNAPQINTAALMLKAQKDNLIANTANTSADTRMKNIQAEIMEEFAGPNTAADLTKKLQDVEKFKFELDKAIADAEISRTTADLLEKKTGQAIKLLSAQAQLGQLNAESSEAIARLLGVAGKDLGPVAKMFLELIKLLSMKGFK